MRSTRITVLGIVVFLFLPILSGCLRIDLRCKPRYNIDEDSVFFSKMPPRTENGANIVAFEVDGKPYVFPREGMHSSIFSFLPPMWECVWNNRKYRFVIRANRSSKRYNPHTLNLNLSLPDGKLPEKGDLLKGDLWFDDYHNSEIAITIIKYDQKKKLLCGCFSPEVLKYYETPELNAKVLDSVFLEGGFFDLIYE